MKPDANKQKPDANEIDNEEKDDAIDENAVEIIQRTDIATLPDDIQTYIKNLRKENRQRRVALSEQESADEEQRRLKLEEDKEYTTLIADLKNENVELKAFKTDYDKYVEGVSERNQVFIDALPAAQKSLVPDYDNPLKVQAYIEQNRATLVGATQQGVDTNAGDSGQNKRNTAKLTNEERTFLTSLGVTVEDAIAFGMEPEKKNKSLIKENN